MNLRTILATTGVTLALSVPTAASATEISHASGFICGNGPTNNRIVRGVYRANFNIRNGSPRALQVDLELALTFPPGVDFEPGAVVGLEAVRLHPGQAVMIDCAELTDAAGLGEDGPPYFAGVLDARSTRALDVTLIQTAGAVNETDGEDAAADDEVSSITITRVPARPRGRRSD